jgi:hypothetical protein
MAHSPKFGESGGVLKWPTQMGDILGAILVHQVR